MKNRQIPQKEIKTPPAPLGSNGITVSVDANGMTLTSVIIDSKLAWKRPEKGTPLQVMPMSDELEARVKGLHGGVVKASEGISSWGTIKMGDFTGKDVAISFPERQDNNTPTYKVMVDATVASEQVDKPIHTMSADYLVELQNFLRSKSIGVIRI